MEVGQKSRVAMVAAASKGVGAMALELAKRGAQVAICARGADRLERTAAEIERSSGRKPLPEVLDLPRAGTIGEFVRAVEAPLGRVDICVTNSGGPPSKVFREVLRDTTVEARTAAVPLLMSTVGLGREPLPRMQKNRGGRLITIASSAVKPPVEGLLLSNSARSAVTDLAKTLANEYAAYGITVNNVCPGYRRTERLDGPVPVISERSGGKPQEVFAEWERPVPAARLGRAEEAASVLGFLASECASYVNSLSIAVGGGLVRSLG